MATQINKPLRKIDISGTITSTSYEDIGDVLSLESIGEDVVFTVTNTGRTLTGFAMLIRTSPDDAYRILIETTGWDSTGNTILVASSGLATLASGSTAYIRCRLGPVSDVKFQAKVSTSSTVVTVRGRAV